MVDDGGADGGCAAVRVCAAIAASTAGVATAAVVGDCTGDGASVMSSVCATGGCASTTADDDSAVSGDRAEGDLSATGDDDRAVVGAISSDGAAGKVCAAGGVVV